MEEKEVKKERRSLRELSWLVTEEEYRNDPAFSYSTLARFEREGFGKLDKLFDKVESPSLTFGSAVDAVITGGDEEFDKNFIIIDFPEISESLVQIARVLYDSYHEMYASLTDIPDSILADVGKECGYYTADKYANYRVKMIKENCTHYYSLLNKVEGKQIISQNTYVDVDNAVKALKNSESTKWYFKENSPFDDIERLYQLKFKMSKDGIDYRCMADLLVVNYDQKVVMPVDLKTSSHYEWEFYKSFLDWNYQIQARLYWRIIRDNMDRDEYFKDFKLADYTFIVVNRNTLTPLKWDFKYTKAIGDLGFGKNKQIVLRDPYNIARDLKYYLESKPSVPLGISNDAFNVNDIADWIDMKM